MYRIHFSQGVKSALLLGLGAAMLCLSAGLRAQPLSLGQEAEEPGEVVIAVMSPSGNPVLDRIGDDHYASAVAALTLDGPLVVDGRRYELVVRHLRGVPGTQACQERAREAVDLGAVAIVGPVTSGCTEAVLGAGLDIPVVTSLSTATELEGSDDWFFRTIANDRVRISRYVRSVDESERIEAGVALYEDSVYGRGLLAHIQSQVGIDDQHIYLLSDIINEPASTHDDIVFTDEFFHEMESHGHDITTVFVLGTDRNVEITRSLALLFARIDSDPSYVLVGSTGDLEALPENSLVIGEARVGSTPNLVGRLAQVASDENLVATLDAGLVVRQAVAEAIGRGGAPEGNGFRETIRTVLADGIFQSAERFRRIQFLISGEVESPPTSPIYRIRPVSEVVNRPDPTPWVEIRVVREPVHHLAGPVVAELIPHGEGLTGRSVNLEAEGLGREAAPVVEGIVLAEEGTTVAFVPSTWTNLFPRNLSLGTAYTPPGDRVEIQQLGWPASYLLAVFFALAGTALFARHRKRQGKVPAHKSGLLLYSERCLAGLLIALLIIHVGPLIDPPGMESQSPFSLVPIPEFGSSWWINAALSGILGGWLGLQFLVSLVAMLTGTLAALFQHNEG